MKTTEKKLRRNWRPFEEARAFIHGLGLKNKTEWAAWIKSNACPSDIPATPNKVYKNTGWNNWGDWLGTQNRRGGFLSFEEARKVIQNLRLANISEWDKWAKSAARPTGIPANPSKTYKNKGWVGWRDWLGEKKSKVQRFRSFLEAREFARSLGFSGGNQWSQWSKTSSRPKDIPSNPQKVYLNQGWASWGDWLGTGFISHSRREHRPFQEARTFAQSLQFQTREEWKTWAKSTLRPQDIPVGPALVYKEDWLGWGDWLGTYRVAAQNRIW